MENRNNIRGASDTGKGRYSTKYLLSGLVICGDCGTKFRRYGRRLASKEYVATLVCMNHQKIVLSAVCYQSKKITIETLHEIEKLENAIKFLESDAIKVDDH